MRKFAYQKATLGADLTLPQLAVLHVLLTYADGAGRGAFPGEKKLAVDCNVSTRTIERHVKALIAKGWLRQIKRGRGSAGTRTEWEFLVPAISDGFSTDTPDEVPDIPDQVPDSSDVATRQFSHQKHCITSEKQPLPDHDQTKDQTMDHGEPREIDAKKRELFGLCDCCDLPDGLCANYKPKRVTYTISTDEVPF